MTTYQLGIEDYVRRERGRQERQLDRVMELMRDGNERTLRQIADACHCSETSASARLRDMRKGPHYINVTRRKDTEITGLWWYRMVGA